MSLGRYATSAWLLLLLWTAACVDEPAPLGDAFSVRAARVPGPGILEVQNRYTPGLLRKEGIIGTAIRLGSSGEQAIAVYALTPSHAAAARLPDRLEGYSLDVVVTGRIMATDYNDPTTRERPAPNGFSVGHYSITAGTIGARVKDASSNVYILSNNHVLAASNDGRIGDAIYQPGPYDGGTASDQIGTLAAFRPINMSITATNIMDAALAAVNAADALGATPSYAYGAPGTEVTDAYIGMPVKKFGRTTGLTAGTVEEVNAFIEVCYLPLGTFLCLESAYFTGQIGIGSGTFSGGGDSGSLIVTGAGNNPVGLLFAGGSTRTFANPIGPVFDYFNVAIDAGTAPPPVGDAEPPTAIFSYTCTNAKCTFDPDSSTDNVGVTAWSWTFGNRKTSTARYPTTSYSKAGTYPVTLVVQDAAGNRSAPASDQIVCTKTGKTLSCT